MLVVCIIWIIFGSFQVHAASHERMKRPSISILHIKLEKYELPENINTSFKAYMDYRMITDTNSQQYAIQQEAYTDEQGFRRIDNDYIIAVGTYYSKRCGERFIVRLEDDTEFTVTIGDIKQDIHTDETHMYHPMANGWGNLLEFIIDTDVMNSEIIKLGDVSSLGFEGQIKGVHKIIEKYR